MASKQKGVSKAENASSKTAKSRAKNQSAGASGLPNSLKLLLVVILLVFGSFQLHLWKGSVKDVMPPTVPAPYLKGWGSAGIKPSQFNEPHDVACDSEGNVYVADTKNCRIQKFDADGKFIKAWGSLGTKDGQFQGPCSLTIDQQNNLWVLDSTTNLVHGFNKDGVFLSKFQGGFYGPYTISHDPAGNLWVANAGGPNVQKFDAKGSFLAALGKAGRGKGQLSDPSGVAVDDSYYYVVDSGNKRIQKFDMNGKYVKLWNPPKDKANQFRRIVLSPAGNLYVGDVNQVWILDKNLNPLKVWQNPLQETLGAISGIAFSKNGFIYLTNFQGNRVMKFGPVIE